MSLQQVRYYSLNSLRCTYDLRTAEKKCAPGCNGTFHRTFVLWFLTPPQDVCWIMGQSLESSLSVNRGPYIIQTACIAPEVILRGIISSIIHKQSLWSSTDGDPNLWYRVSSYHLRLGVLSTRCCQLGRVPKRYSFNNSSIFKKYDLVRKKTYYKLIELIFS